MADSQNYAVVIQRNGWDSSAQGVYPIAFKVLKASKNSVEIDASEAVQKLLLDRHGIRFFNFRKKSGIRVVREGGYLRSRGPEHYYVENDTVLTLTDGPKLPKAIVTEFEALIEAAAKAKKNFETAESKALKQFDAEETAMQTRHSAERDDLDARRRAAYQPAQMAYGAAVHAVHAFATQKTGAQ